MSGLANRRKVIGFTATTAVLLATLAGGGAAQADPASDSSAARVAPQAATGRLTAAAVEHIPSVCNIRSYGPATIVLGASPVTKTFSVKASGCTISDWSVVLGPFYDGAPLSTKGIAGTYWYWDQNAAGKDVKVQLKPKITLSPRALSNSYAGKIGGLTRVRAWGEEDPASTAEVVVDPDQADLYLRLQRRATFGSTFNASPEPVHVGDRITLKATIKRINWNGAKKLQYKPFPGNVWVEFKPDGGSKYLFVKGVSTSTKGVISTTVRATASGRWRLHFYGYSSTSPAISPSDAVKVN